MQTVYNVATDLSNKLVLGHLRCLESKRLIFCAEISSLLIMQIIQDSASTIVLILHQIPAKVLNRVIQTAQAIGNIKSDILNSALSLAAAVRNLSAYIAQATVNSIKAAYHIVVNPGDTRLKVLESEAICYSRCTVSAGSTTIRHNEGKYSIQTSIATNAAVSSVVAKVAAAENDCDDKERKYPAATAAKKITAGTAATYRDYRNRFIAIHRKNLLSK